MDADVYERAEVGNVGDHAFEYHTDLQVADFVDAFGKGGRLKLAARVAAGFFQFGQDVQNGRQTEAFVNEVGRFDLLHALAVNYLNMRFLVFLSHKFPMICQVRFTFVVEQIVI